MQAGLYGIPFTGVDVGMFINKKNTKKKERKVYLII
jgi:hypothetical protein